MLTAEWLHLVLYISTENQNDRQNIIILFVNMCSRYLGLRLGSIFFGIQTSKIANVCYILKNLQGQMKENLPELYLPYQILVIF
jgi:hypothetical protein